MNKSAPSPIRRPPRPAKAADLAEREWVVAATPPRAAKLAVAADLPIEIAAILLERGVKDATSAERFLHPSIADLGDPFLMHGMAPACDRIHAAISAGERICIFGDYDVDGITSTVILVDALRTLGADVTYYIPHRVDEGYGLNADAIRSIAADAVRLIISVDCGVTALEEVALAVGLGVDVVITDHHRPGEALPTEASAVVHPALGDPPYPFPELAGVGVAFKVAQALLDEDVDGDGARLGTSKVAVRAQRFLDLVSMGTMADSVPLLGENRVLVAEGLKALQKTTRPGLRALMGVAGLLGKKLVARDISFGLAPRLNAAGRLDTAQTCVDLLLSADRTESERIADALNVLNRDRQAVEEVIRKRAEEIITTQCDPDKDHILFLAETGWHTGVQGIVASKMLDKYSRPTFMLSIEDGVAKGSARSFGSYHLHQALTRCSDLLVRFGGHAYAAGLVVKAEDLPELKSRLSAIAEEMMTPEDLMAPLHLDAQVDVDRADQGFFETLRRLAPHGVGNPEPSFLLRGHAVEAKRIGKKSEHLRFSLFGGSSHLGAVAFHRPDDPASGQVIEVAAHLEIDEWKETEKLQLKVIDMRTRAEPDVDTPVVKTESQPRRKKVQKPEPFDLPAYLAQAAEDGFPAAIELTSHRDLMQLTERLIAGGSGARPGTGPILWLTASDLASRMLADWVSGGAGPLATRVVLLSRTRTLAEERTELDLYLGSAEYPLIIGCTSAFGMKGAAIERIAQILGTAGTVITIDWPDESSTRLAESISASTGATAVRARFSAAITAHSAYKVVDRRNLDVSELLAEVSSRDPGFSAYHGIAGHPVTRNPVARNGGAPAGKHPFEDHSGHIVLAAPPLSAWAMKQFCLSAWGRRTMIYLAYSKSQMEAEAAYLDETAPDRDRVARVYNAIRAAEDGLSVAAASRASKLSETTVRVAMRYLEEIAVIRTLPSDDGGVIAMAESAPKKTSLDESPSKNATDAELSAFAKIRSYFVEGHPYAFERFLDGAR